MSIDELLGLSVEELEKLSDEELLTRYAPIFKLEPDVPITEVSEGDTEEDTDSSATAKVPRAKAKRAESKAKIADLKKKLMEASRQGMSADELFEKDFG